MRKIRMGMVGGGRDAFIGAVHRTAAALDGQIDLVCGAFSSTAEKSKASGADLFLPAARVYANYEEMFIQEAALSDSESMDFVAIVTPNNSHFDIASKALRAGFHVMSDKPATLNLQEARALQTIVTETGLLYGLTHNYTGYPLVKEARKIIREGRIGKVRKVVVEYSQGWLSTKLEDEDNKQAAWRTDPAQSGACGCMGDIGTHAENLLEYMTGLRIIELSAELTTFVEGRRLEDDGNVLLRLDNGARGILFASQISVGEENNLNIRVYGEQGAVSWQQQEPNRLVLNWLDRPEQVIRAGANNDLAPVSVYNSRTPGGHPEGYLEAFGNLYRNFAGVLQARLEGREPDPDDLDFPTIDDGVRGMAFLEALIESAESTEKWTRIVEA
ncbi:MAG: Gfo/Idh/MocA family oxidoreductase [Pseudomonadales bacterium]|jgi:predicted dehydrogenase|nr:Gfo/Idh/MocA family oxidoreductase [Pseudomonadales bacterium]MDP7357945.1 Gfo/Idh/MocA family oxidoreductase [Pseudomonadales bacterium]MDP7595625.1 Gfo/Idh/MocA family oxidoreductase [Pseudomonadales bacterium]HJN49629.1 Gfo/Idh/MocA family oxidoreductase [Pseudomonadales bacterium]|tara:strand:- start:691 stop:1851 length:1161 start_codon:yes stop_codon:yes gene_type:complete